MRVLLTGGTGFIGREVVSALRARGDEVIVVSRRREAGSVAWDAVGGEVAKADAVVHLAGEPVAGGRWTDARLEAIRASRVDSTALLAHAIAKAARKPRVFVSGSAVGIYGTRVSDAWVDEETPAAGDALARVCVAWEEAAAPAVAAGVRVTHPRTGVVLGTQGGALEQMLRPFKLFVGGPIGSGRQWLSWIHLNDEVRALLFAIDEDLLTGPFNVVSPEPATNETFSHELAHVLHRPAAMRVPAIALKLAVGEGLASVLLTGQRAAPRKLLAAGFTFAFPKLEDALADLVGKR